MKGKVWEAMCIVPLLYVPSSNPYIHLSPSTLILTTPSPPLPPPLPPPSPHSPPILPPFSPKTKTHLPNKTPPHNPPTPPEYPIQPMPSSHRIPHRSTLNLPQTPTVILPLTRKEPPTSPTSSRSVPRAAPDPSYRAHPPSIAIPGTVSGTPHFTNPILLRTPPSARHVVSGPYPPPSPFPAPCPDSASPSQDQHVARPLLPSLPLFSSLHAARRPQLERVLRLPQTATGISPHTTPSLHQITHHCRRQTWPQHRQGLPGSIGPMRRRFEPRPSPSSSL